MTDIKERWYRFSGLMMDTRDIDPTYPVLKELNRMDRDDFGAVHNEEHELWRTLLYVALYHIGASELVRQELPVPDAAEVEAAIKSGFIGSYAGRAGIERRGLRTPRFLEDHLRAILSKREAHGTFRAWLSTGHTGDPAEDWRKTVHMLMNVDYNGRWAAYKTCDILVETHGWEMEAPDAGHRFSTGPRHGLGQLFDDGLMPWAQSEDLPVQTDQTERAIQLLDKLTVQVQRDLWANGVPVKVSEVETLLCNWHSFRKRHYYVGHDIDEMLERILWVPDRVLRSRLMLARRRALPVELLGEVQGWTGIRKELMGTV